MKHVVIGPLLAEMRTRFRTFYLLNHFLPPSSVLPSGETCEKFLVSNPAAVLFVFQTLFCHVGLLFLILHVTSDASSP